MINAIINNPYRIFGVYANSSKKELIANKGKIQAFLRVNKTMLFKLDLKYVLPEVVRTQELIEYADSELALSAGQIKNAQFWFFKKTPIDEIAFNHLTDGNINKAIDIWSKTTNFTSLQNLFVCYLIKNDYKSAIVDCAIPIYNRYAQEIVSTIDENAKYSPDELINTIVDTLTNEGVDLMKYLDSIGDSLWISQIRSKKVDPIIAKLDACLLEAKAQKGKGAKARLHAGYNLKNTVRPLISILSGLLPPNDVHFQIIVDKISHEVLQCSIDYYNESNDLDKPTKALVLCEFAKSIAVGAAAKQRCEENYLVIKEAVENMPPIEVAQEVQNINEILAWYSKQGKLSKIALVLLKRARLPLLSIKEKLGKKSSFYLEKSSLIGNAALNYVIEEVNNAHKDNRANVFGSIFHKAQNYLNQEDRLRKASKLKEILHDAWQTIVYIDLLDKTKSFDNRYQQNRNTLYSIIKGVNGFIYPNNNYILRGCAYGITAEKRFFFSDSEYYENCSCKSDYQNYLKAFPDGIHAKDAEQKIRKIEKHEKNVKYSINIAAIVAFIIFLVIIFTNITRDNASDEIMSSDNSSLNNDVKYFEEIDYSDNYLTTGSRPYSSVYGGEYYFSEYDQYSTFKIIAPNNCDVVVLIKNENQNGDVVDHVYIRQGGVASVNIPNGTYQPFFYFGKGWNPNKKMPNGVKGGFVSMESISKDDPQYMYNNILTYTLTVQYNGNFRAKSSNKQEAF